MKKRFPLCVLLLIATEAPGRAQPAGPEATERQQRAKVATFADHVVRVLIFSDDDQVRPQGWGLIVGRDNNKLYIATPYHVVHNQDSPATSHIEIRFQNMPDHKVRAEILDTTANSPLDGLDLAVLSVSGADGRTLGAAPVATLGPEDGGTWVWTIGRQDSWTISATHGGFIESLTATDRLSFGGLVTPRGTSGQAVASSDGIVGMVTNDTGAGETWAIAAARIISQFRIAGLPVNLLGLGVNAAPLASSSAEPVDHVPTGLPQQGASLPAPAAAISNPNKSAGPKYEINLRGSLAHQSLQIVRPPSDAISTQHAGDTFASVHVTSPTIERIMSTSEAGWGAHTLISGDGTVIVGYADNYNRHISRWTESTGIQDLGDMHRESPLMEGISGNGSVIVGYFDPGRGFNKPGEAGFTLSSLGKFEVLVIPKSPSNGGFVEAVSADGSVVVGWYQDLSGRSHAVRWKGTTKSQDLGGMSKLDAYPKFVSANGSIVVGTFHAGTFDDGTLKEHVFRWEEPGRVQDLGTMDGPDMGTFRNLGPGTNVFVDAISSDGSVIVGRSIDASGTIGIYRWTVGGGVQHLGNLHAPNLELWPTAVSDDGSVIVGNMHPLTADKQLFDKSHPFLWSEIDGLQDFGTLGGDEAYASGVSADGRIIVGQVCVQQRCSVYRLKYHGR